MKEIWKCIVGYEGLYQVSSFGRVKNISRIVNCRNGGKRIIKEKILSPGINGAGYYFVALCNGKQISKTVHRLVAEAFINNGKNVPIINHKNGIKTDNRSDNLEWCTYSENGRHSVDVLNNDYNSAAKLTTDQVKEIRQLYLTGSFSTHNLSKLFLISQSNVWNIVRMKTWKKVV